ncbi:MAG: sulfurtransferase [Fimbriimonadaceae bacterium]|nr:sulfurtransferase [Fimbriimonadaceae bacterium]QYK55711.1 MAG: sulfurtransferase [Fimbriimonadaceae bacterium]
MTEQMSDIRQRGYAHPNTLVSTDWVAEHLNDPLVRLVESNEDPLLYSSGHIPGAVEIDWTRDLNDPIVRDYLDQARFEELMSRCGITPATQVVFYGDRNNWWACYAFWIFQLFGHQAAAVMDGGRLKWSREGRPMTTDIPEYPATTYAAQPRDDRTDRAFREDVLLHIAEGGGLVDVRSPQEFTGERLHMPEYPNEGALRGGHIPTAKSVPWARALNPDTGEFLTAEELRKIYEQEVGLKPDAPAVAYCRIGERSSHTWFVLKYLLGFKDVRNYDGSWTEWGNSVGVPIER